MLTLHVTPAQGEPFSHDVVENELVIGRSMSSDLSVPDRYLSRQHARLYRSDDQWLIEDLDSRNGTYVNGLRITEPTRVKVGDMVTMSASTIRVMDRSGVAPTMTRQEMSGSVFRPATELVAASTHLPEAAEREDDSIRRSAERLSLLNQVHQTLATTIDLAELLDTILDRMFDHLKPEQGTIFLRGPEGDLYRAASRPASAGEDEIVVSQSLSREVVERGMAALVHDVRLDDRFAGAQSLVDAGVRSLIAAPLADPRGTQGMIVLSSSARVRVFSEEDMQLLSSLASVAALRIRNLSLAEEAAERRRLQKEVTLARQIQMALIPDELPTAEGYEIYGGNSPWEGVSGDYFEVIERGQGCECVMLIADVSGKGIAASLLTTYIEALSTAPIEDGLPPDEVFERVSRRLYKRTPHERFATAFLAVLDRPTSMIRYANAGHSPGLVVRSGGEVDWLGSTGLPLGLLATGEYHSKEVTLAVGDTLVLYTDGITEALNPDGEEYGAERLRSVCQQNADKPLDDIALALDDDLARFSAGVPFADDRTLVMLRRTE
jgi:serine phosphatase RsbU (regulator of sigma subunit)/pSer/pThr/pTyr-binding forkhead associated (FHA) protein